MVESRLRAEVNICEQQHGFMPRKSTTNAEFVLRMLLEECREKQRELHCVFVDLEIACDKVPREEVWYCMKKVVVLEMYAKAVQDMHDGIYGCVTMMRWATGLTENFKMVVGLHQGSALSPLLFAIVMDQLTEEVRHESPCNMMFADDIAI